MKQKFLSLSLILCASFSSQAADIEATLNCKVKWETGAEPVDLSSNDRCAENCKVQGVGPEGLSFSGETSSASRVKLTISSLPKNETLIFVKEFEFEQLVGKCADADISKDGAQGVCTLCVTQ